MTEGKKLAIPERPEQGVSVFSPQEGVVLGEEDQRLPILVLCQAQSEQGEPGMFLRRDTEQVIEAPLVVPVRVQKTRTFWGPGGFSRDRTPVCYSMDGQRAAGTRGDGEPTWYPGRECRTCEHYTAAPWRDRDEEQWCKGGFAVCLWDVDTQGVYIMRLSGTAARKALAFAAKGAFRQMAFRLSSEHVTSDRGTWYQFRVEPERQITESEAPLVQAAFEAARDAVMALDDAGAGGGTGGESDEDRMRHAQESPRVQRAMEAMAAQEDHDRQQGAVPKAPAPEDRESPGRRYEEPPPDVEPSAWGDDLPW